MGTFKTSTGERVSKKVIDSRVRKAKGIKLLAQLEEHGYNFCEKTGKNANCGEPLDCAHLKSVDFCQKNGCAELAWDLDNIMILCRSEHQKHDKLNINGKDNI